MSPELDAKLCAAFPLLYADRNKPMRETCMCWGFEHGDGWFSIIWDLSEKLERMIAALDPADFPEGYGLPRASQVKEKYGTLRFYMTASTDEMEDAIREAEKLSARTCERCGAPGSLRGRGWLSTRCDSCWAVVR